jgi:hypothetical protein
MRQMRLRGRRARPDSELKLLFEIKTRCAIFMNSLLANKELPPHAEDRTQCLFG